MFNEYSQRAGAVRIKDLTARAAALASHLLQ
jgi:hypothetical protein